MASGRGRRFGGNKLLHPVEGTPLIQRTMDALPPRHFCRAAVVSDWPEVLDLARRGGFLPVENPLADEGQAASVRLGLQALGEVDGALFAVCDQPFLKTESIIKLLDCFAETPERICALSWAGKRGNPVVFPAALFPELLALTGDVGGGAVIRAHPERLRLVEAADPAELRDVDTLADLGGS